MRIVVVGAIVADTIEAPGGSVSESLGGIAHTISTLAATAPHTFVPLCRVGEDRRELVESWAASIPGVSLEAVVPMKQPTPRVHLSYAEAGRDGERAERLLHSPPPLSERDVEVAAGADLVVVNCITGDDCTVAAMRALSAACDRVYLDVHSLTYGTAPDGARYHRRREDWWSWFECADVVQCNLPEAATICDLDPATVHEAEATAAVERMLLHAPGENRMAGGRSRPSVWLLTLGANGATVFDRRGGGAEVRSTHVPAPPVDVVDPTGAGDAFGAGYASAWLNGDEPDTAARHAVRCGSAACANLGLPSVAVLRSGLSSLV